MIFVYCRTWSEQQDLNLCLTESYVASKMRARTLIVSAGWGGYDRVVLGWFVKWGCFWGSFEFYRRKTGLMEFVWFGK